MDSVARSGSCPGVYVCTSLLTFSPAPSMVWLPRHCPMPGISKQTTEYLPAVWLLALRLHELQVANNVRQIDPRETELKSE